MEMLIRYYRKVELFFGNLKFAVVIITLFAIYLGYGTFMESYHGTEYANRLVYKSIPFMAIQFCMFLSILFATLIRLPPKKHLYGFYVIHAGLIILFLGSYITYKSGIDGNITLAPNTASRHIQLNEDELKIQFPGKGKEVTVSLPFNSSEKQLNLEYEGIKLKKFLPFAENELQWIPTKISGLGSSSSRYRIYNDNFGEFFTLSLHPESDFNNTTQLGPLNVHYMPENLAECFVDDSSEGLIVWNGENNLCLALDKADIKRRKAINGKNVIEVNFSGQSLAFLPEMSPMPLNQSMQLDENSPFRIFSKNLFQNSPHLFLFGKFVAFYNKENSKWEGSPIKIDSEVSLPWMGFKVRLLEHRDDAYAAMKPVYVTPIQDNSQIIKGNLKAVEVEIGDQSFWVTSDQPVGFNQSEGKIRFELGKKLITLPYELVLDQFKMDTDPGTNNPASYESYVTLFKGNQGSEKHHIYMNHPLKFNNFTFYQASYFQTQQGPFGSVLSVNYDPGRPWKYLGSLLLVLGSIWHYFLRRKYFAKSGVKNA